MAESSLSFPPFILDHSNACVWRGKKKILLARKDFAVLSYLASRPNQLVTIDTLLAEVWKIRVSRSVVKVCLYRLRQALDDSATTPQVIENLPRRGYRFIAPVRPATDDEGQAESPHPEQHPPIVGRTTELRQLHGALDEALKGQRQCVFVTGEPGIGKSTLVRTFLEHVLAAGTATVGRGQCIELHGVGEPYRPVLEALARIGRAPGGEVLVAGMKEHAPTWLAQLPALLRTDEFAALQRELQGATHERMLREMSEGIEIMTQQRPLILLLEDLQWCDYSTLALVAALARRPERARFLLIGTYRPSDLLSPDHPLKSGIQELRIHDLCTELALPPLSQDDIATYLQSRFSGRALPPMLPHVLYRRTEGHPFFLVTVVDDLVTQGLLESVRKPENEAPVAYTVLANPF